MQMSGEQSIAADRDTVWRALNDPQTLRGCIPGCESIAATGENRYAVSMTAVVGPVKAKFNAKLVLSDVVPPISYTMAFDGSGGAAGFGKGQASLLLADEGQGGTRLSYTAQAHVGGKLAQVGARLIDGVARKLADEFFTRFKSQVEVHAQEPAAVPQPGTAHDAAAENPAPVSASSVRSGRAFFIWMVSAALAACAVGGYLLLGRR